jgi:thiosulfate dehydrogenase [quinone] large subunit
MQKTKKLYKMRILYKPSDLKRFQLISLAVLRITIGWHLLYEGLIKVADPDWSSLYFLANSTGPFASVFKAIPANLSLLGIADFLNQWGLVAIGLSLMIGLFSRWAYIGGIVLLGLYYFANPPFIGLPEIPMQEGNYLIINKNLIEAVALWVLFQFNDSRVFGVDYFLKRKQV